MALTNPKPPTAPTPPVIDKGDGANTHAKIDAKQLLGIHKENSDAGEENISEPAEEIFEEVEEFSPNEQIGTREVTTPETMARDAVANGGGSLTKRTVEKPQEREEGQGTREERREPSLNFAITEDDRGKAALREFQKEDRQNNSEKSQSLTESPRPVKLNLQESHGGFYWAIVLVFALVLSVVFVKKMLLTDKPKLKKSDLFEGTGEKLKKTKEKIVKPTYQPPKPAPIQKVKPVKLPKKDDEDKGKNFEVRV